jgi:hypothetical protein
MSIFLTALNSVAPHFRVRGHLLSLSQGHPFHRVEIDLRKVAAHKMPGPATLRLRLFREHWRSFSMEGFRPSEVSVLCALLTRWERQNHLRSEQKT